MRLIFETKGKRMSDNRSLRCTLIKQQRDTAFLKTLTLLSLFIFIPEHSPHNMANFVKYISKLTVFIYQNEA